MTRTITCPLALVVALLAGCTFQGTDPTIAHCSAAEPACPAGTSCNVATGLCVGKSSDARADVPGADHAVADGALEGPRPDRARDQPFSREKGTDKALADKPLADKLLADKLLADKLLADKLLADKLLADKALNTDKLKPDTKPDTLKPDTLKPDTKPPCGNNTIDPGEDCDGLNLGTADCLKLGRNGGTLACNPATCKFDLTACCVAPVPPGGLVATAIVSASVGNDATVKPLCTPYKTISKALGAPPSSLPVVIWVTPGTYDAANGETFPLKVSDYVMLVGDEGAKGSSPSGVVTAIDGSGTAPSTYVTSLFQVGPIGKVTVKGFLFKAAGSNAPYGIDNNGLPMTITANTFSGTHGINLANAGGSNGGCPTITQNHFKSQSRGIYSQCTGNTLLVDNNQFVGVPMGLYITQGNGIVRNSTFIDCSIPIQVDNVAPLLDSNTFTLTGSATTYSYGAIKLWYGSPRVRKCLFKNGPAVYTAGGVASVPDLGLATDPGNNDFTVLTGIAVRHTVGSAVSAIGNTWATGPVCSHVDITVPGGTVTWGTSAGQTCP